MVRGIPEGYVATYGQIALLAGRPGRARLVGQVLVSVTWRLVWFLVLVALLVGPEVASRF